jgi:hypothetical protein
MLIPPRDRDVLGKTRTDGGKLRNLFLKIASVPTLLLALAIGAATGTAQTPGQPLTPVPVILGHGNFFLIDPSTGRIPVAANLTGLVPLPDGGRFKLTRFGIFHWTGTLPTGGPGCAARMTGVSGALDRRVIRSRGKIRILGTLVHPVFAGRTRLTFEGARSVPVSSQWFVLRASKVRRHPLAAVAVMRLPAGIAPELSQRYLYFSLQAQSSCNRTHPGALARYMRGVATAFSARVGG